MSQNMTGQAATLHRSGKLDEAAQAYRAASPLFDMACFARDLEALYRRIAVTSPP